MGPNFVVPPRSWASISKATQELRERFGLVEQPRFPIMELMEHVLDNKLRWLHLRVGTPDEMDQAEGLTDPMGEFVVLREDVYNDAWRGDGRARFTASHELGHWVLHARVPMARAKPNTRYAPYLLAEQQANHFAAELLMPREFISPEDTAESIVRRHGVSKRAAEVRLRYLHGS